MPVPVLMSYLDESPRGPPGAEDFFYWALFQERVRQTVIKFVDPEGRIELPEAPSILE